MQATLRTLLGLLAATAMLPACGGSQNAAMPQTVTAQTEVHKASGSYGALIYVSTTKRIVMLSYPGGQVVGTIPWYGSNPNLTICSDPNDGNVFVPEGNSIYEYAHGATSPSAMLVIPSGDQDYGGCAVDPNTGNLAVIAGIPPNNRAGFLVYYGGQGTPRAYVDEKVNVLVYAAYDDSGDLFSVSGARGGRIAELRPGKSKFNFLKFVNCTACNWGKLQWDGQYMALPYYYDGNQLGIGQLEIGRTTATLVNTVKPLDMAHGIGGLFWIYNGSLFGEYQKRRRNNNQGVGVWPYPAGGYVGAKYYGLTKGIKDYIYDFTVSVAPSK